MIFPAIPSTRFLSLIWLALSSAAVPAADPRSPVLPPSLNVLFIAVDDLRPELGCYGQPVLSPNIDRLAAEGTLFERSYVQLALCKPSRESMLTGRRPDTTGVVDFATGFRDVLPGVVTLPQHFKNHGYHAVGFGKVFHDDDRISWSEPLFVPLGREDDYHTEFGKQVLGWLKEDYRRLTYVWDLGDGIIKTKRPGGLPWEAPEVPDNALRDGQLAEAALAKLDELAGRPFFLAVGFHKPHLPFIAPRKYFDLYDPAKIAPAANPFPPRNAPKFATYNWNDLRHYYGIPDVGPVSEMQARELKHAYYACVSFVDAQVGRLLTRLEELGLRQRTVVLLWGDHGWQLGEHGMWDKHSNFETSTRAPLIVSVPGGRPGRSKALVESVDIFPTLCVLAGLPLDSRMEGDSFAPLLQDPGLEWKSAAFSQYQRVIPGHGAAGPGMGYSMRTDRYRFTEWILPGTDFVARELYDHDKDPGENENLANQPELRELTDTLAARLHAGWRSARPPR